MPCSVRTACAKVLGQGRAWSFQVLQGQCRQPRAGMWARAEEAETGEWEEAAPGDSGAESLQEDKVGQLDGSSTWGGGGR